MMFLLLVDGFVGGRPTSRGRRSFALPREPPTRAHVQCILLDGGPGGITTFRDLVDKTLSTMRAVSDENFTISSNQEVPTTRRGLKSALCVENLLSQKLLTVLLVAKSNASTRKFLGSGGGAFALGAARDEPAG